jgi:hypothetical protein
VLGRLEIPHYIAGWTTYTPDGKYHIGDLTGGNYRGPKGLFVASGCNGSGLSSAGGYGRIVAELVGEVGGGGPGVEGGGGDAGAGGNCGDDGTYHAEREAFDPTRFLITDFFAEPFRRFCAASRGKKFRRSDLD